MDINSLKTFVTICEYGSFTAAAEKLGYTQPTVSAQIKQLEKELDTILFDRVGHNTYITVQGNTVLEYAREILMTHQKMQDALHRPEQISGEIHLAMSSSICSRFFTEDYVEFHRLYPAIKLMITSADTELMINLLKKNEADIVFTLDSHIYDSRYTICAESVEKVHFVASASHPLARRDDLEITDLVNETFYLTEPNMSYRHLMDLQLAEKSLAITPVMEIGNPRQICRIMRKSQALSLLPDYATEKYIAEGSIVKLDVRDMEIEVWNQILINKNKWISPAMEVFIDFYKEKISK